MILVIPCSMGYRTHDTSASQMINASTVGIEACARRPSVKVITAVVDV